MTAPMPDPDLADLRNTLERATEFYGEITARHITAGYTIIPLASIDIDDVRALVARLDAAEELIREVANSGVEFDDERLDNVSVQIGRHEWNQCRSYLR